MPSPAELPEWLTEGARVAIDTFGSSRDGITFGTVEKIDKAFVTVAGEKYPIRNLTRRWGGSYGGSASLHNPNNPDIVARVRKQNRTATLRALGGAAVACCRDFDANAEVLRAAIQRIAPHLGLTVTRDETTEG